MKGHKYFVVAIFVVITGRSSPASVEIMPVGQAPTEVRIEFTSKKNKIQPGECAMLAWGVEAGLRRINGQPVEKQGQMEVCPTEMTSYPLSEDAGTRLEKSEVVIRLADGDQPPSASPTAPVVSGVNVIRDVPICHRHA